MIPTPDPGPSPNSAPLPAVVQLPRTPVSAVLPASQALAAKPDPIALLRALQRRWVLASVIGFLCAGIAASIAWYAVPPSKYVAKSMLHVASIQPNIIFETKEARINFDLYKQTQLMLLKGRSVLNSVLRNPEVSSLRLVKQQANRVVWLEKAIQADYTGEILNISMSGSSPDGLAIIVNTVAEAYLEEVVNVEAKERKKRYDKLKEIYSDYQVKLKTKREILEKLAKQIGTTNKDNVRLTHAFAIESRAMMEKELRQIRIDLRKAETEFAVQRQFRKKTAAGASIPDEGTIPDSVIDKYIQADGQVQQYQARINQLNKAIAVTKSLVRSPSDPSILHPQQELRLISRQLAARQRELRLLIVEQLRAQARVEGQDSDQSTLEERIEVLKELEKLTAADVKILSEEAGSINENSLHLEDIQDEIVLADAAAKRVGNEVEALNIELNAPSRVRLIESASTPLLENDKRPKTAGMAGIAAFALVLLGVSWCEFRARRIDSADEVVHCLGMRLVGTLPTLPVRSRLLDRKDAQSLRWQNLLIESVDAARTALLHISRTESVRVVMVASALGGEGKTSLASHLATSLARAGRQALLIDGDLRRPSAHQLFDLPSEPGLSEVLRGEAEITDVIRPTPVNGVWLVPAGHSDSKAIQALAYKDLRAILDRVKERYDFVVIDSSPVLPVSDALLIGQNVDAVLFSIMRNVSRLPKVQAAYERMSSLGIRMLGAIVTGAQGDFYGNEYQYVVRSRDQA
jgi:succinoglycan biosynthesis transport protein ExoP